MYYYYRESTECSSEGSPRDIYECTAQVLLSCQWVFNFSPSKLQSSDAPSSLSMPCVSIKIANLITFVSRLPFKPKYSSPQSGDCTSNSKRARTCFRKEMNEWAGNVELQQDFSTHIQPRREINLVITASG